MATLAEIKEYIFLEDDNSLDFLGFSASQVDRIENEVAAAMIRSQLAQRYRFPTNPDRLIDEHILQDFLVQASHDEKELLFSHCTETPG